MKFLPPKFNLFAFKSHRKIGCSSLLEREGERLRYALFQATFSELFELVSVGYRRFLEIGFPTFSLS